MFASNNEIQQAFCAEYAVGYSEPVPIEQLVHHLCDQKQGYTQFVLASFGVSFLRDGIVSFYPLDLP